MAFLSKCVLTFSVNTRPERCVDEIHVHSKVIKMHFKVNTNFKVLKTNLKRTDVLTCAGTRPAAAAAAQTSTPAASSGAVLLRAAKLSHLSFAAFRVGRDHADRVRSGKISMSALFQRKKKFRAMFQTFSCFEGVFERFFTVFKALGSAFKVFPSVSKVFDAFSTLPI